MTALMPVAPGAVSPDFADFYRSHRRRIANTLALSMGDRELGFEATDEAMSRAYQRWGDVSSYSNPAGWVFRTGRNWAISVTRRRTKGRQKDQLAAHSAVRQDEQPDTDLEKAVAQLKDDHRSIVMLRFYSDRTIDQIAIELGIPSGTVKSRLSRALRALHQDLKPVDSVGF